MHATSAIRGVREWRETGSTGRSGKAATCGRAGLKPIATLFSVRSRSRWTSRLLNLPRCFERSMGPYLRRARSGVFLIVTQ